MRVVFGTFDDFCQEVRKCAGTIRGGIVRVLTTREPEQSECLTFSCGIIATAVDDSSAEPTLLEVAVHTGKDEAETKRTKAVSSGSENSDLLKSNLASHCKEAGLEIRPGKIELY